ncbi:MAG: alpha-glucuronidase family glycosyl hydrolase, partial [Janthinobacterium lividum]
MPFRKLRHGCFLLLCLASIAALSVRAQSTIGWLRYAIPPDPPRYHGMPHTVVLLGNSGQAAPEELAAADELDRGLGHMVAGTDIVLHRFDPRIDAIVLGTTEALHRARIGRTLPGWTEKPLPEEGFRIVHLRRGIREWYILQGGSPRAELWAAFRFAALVAEDQQLPEDFTDAPRLPLRSVDLGHAPELLPLLESKTPRSGLARLLASTGINGVLV